MSAPQAQPQGSPRAVVLAHGSLRHADFRDRIAVGAITGDLRPTAIEGFAALCDRAAEHGLLVALEPQACSSIADLATATAIVAGAGRPNGGLNVDVWHQTRGGWPLPALRGLAPEQVVVIQVDDGPGLPRRLLVYDHVLGAVHADRDPPLPGPYTEHDPFHEPLVLLGFLHVVRA